MLAEWPLWHTFELSRVSVWSPPISFSAFSPSLPCPLSLSPSRRFFDDVSLPPPQRGKHDYVLCTEGMNAQMQQAPILNSQGVTPQLFMNLPFWSWPWSEWWVLGCAAAMQRCTAMLSLLSIMIPGSDVVMLTSKEQLDDMEIAPNIFVNFYLAEIKSSKKTIPKRFQCSSLNRKRICVLYYCHFGKIIPEKKTFSVTDMHFWGAFIPKTRSMLVTISGQSVSHLNEAIFQWANPDAASRNRLSSCCG